MRSGSRKRLGAFYYYIDFTDATSGWIVDWYLWAPVEGNDLKCRITAGEQWQVFYITPKDVALLALEHDDPEVINIAARKIQLEGVLAEFTVRSDRDGDLSLLATRKDLGIGLKFTDHRYGAVQLDVVVPIAVYADVISFAKTVLVHYVAPTG